MLTHARFKGVSVASRTSTFYNIGAATQGFLLWGSWGFYVNYKVSLVNGITSGLVQGIFSFIATLAVIRALTFLFNLFEMKIMKYIIPTFLMVSALIFLSIIAHTFAGTPEILKTITPNLFVSTLFCIFTTYKLINGKAH